MSTQPPALPPTFTLSVHGPIPIKVGPCPRGNDNESADAMRAALAALKKLDDERQKLSRDPSFTAVGRRSKLNELIEAAVQRLTVLQLRHDAELAEAQILEDKLYAVPSLPASDAVAAAVDVETRTWFRGLSDEAKMKIVSGAEAGYNMTMLAMLMRGAIPYAPGVHDVLVQGWRSYAGRQNQALVKQINTHKETATWIGDVLGMLCIATKRTADDIGLQVIEVVAISKKYGGFINPRLGYAQHQLQSAEKQLRMAAAA